jgi:hypothetical protein
MAIQRTDTDILVDELMAAGIYTAASTGAPWCATWTACLNTSPAARSAS